MRFGRWWSRCCRLRCQNRRAVGHACRPCRPDRYPLRVAVRGSVGDAAPGNGLWVRHDVLAQGARLAGGRRLEPPPACAPRPPGTTQRHRLSARRPRQRVGCGKKGGAQTGPNPTDRGKPGSKRHVLTDANGIPLAVRLTGGNVHDSGMLKEVVDAVLPIRQALPAARQAACRQGLRSPPLPPRPDQPPHPASDRTPWHPEQRQAGAAPLDLARRNLPKTNTKTAPISPSHLNPVLIPPGLSPVTRQIVRDWVERSMPRVWLNLLTTKRTVDLCYWLQEEHRVTGAKRGGLFVG